MLLNHVEVRLQYEKENLIRRRLNQRVDNIVRFVYVQYFLLKIYLGYLHLLNDGLYIRSVHNLDI